MTETQNRNPGSAPAGSSAKPALASASAGWPSLKSERIQLALLGLPGWQLAADERSIRFAVRYAEPAMALAYAQFAFTVGRRMAHFPELRLVGGSLEIVAWTAESDGVTEQDLELARMLSPGAEKPS